MERGKNRTQKKAKQKRSRGWPSRNGHHKPINATRPNGPHQRQLMHHQQTPLTSQGFVDQNAAPVLSLSGRWVNRWPWRVIRHVTPHNRPPLIAAKRRSRRDRECLYRSWRCPFCSCPPTIGRPRTESRDIEGARTGWHADRDN